MSDKEYIKNISSISTEDLFNSLEYYGYDSYYAELWEATIEELKKRIEIRPQGKWICKDKFDGYELGYSCSNCRIPEWRITRFCPNCGAEMRKGDED